MRRTPLKKKSKTEIAKLKEELWELCKAITRKRYGNTCYTCGKEGLTGSNWHTGHFIPSAAGGADLRYELDNLRCQCYHCNVNLGGNGTEYYRRMLEKEGKKYVDTLFKRKQNITKLDKIYILDKIEQYKLILEKLNDK
jgi:5-methylcytosine-specific restriction endonuclease McrA